MTTRNKKRQARIEKKRRKRRRRGRPARDPAPPERRPPPARASRTRDERTPGYAGMPRSEWTDWRQVAETFVAERPHADDAQVVGVLTLCLRVGSWGDFLAGRWLQFVGTEIYVAYVEGYSFRRGYQLMDRFVRWMHGRGDLTDWQRDVLLTEIDDARSAHGAPRKRATRTVEMVVSKSLNRDRVIAEFAASLDDPAARAVAPSMLVALDEAMRPRLGDPLDLPLGSLDPEPFVVAWLDARGPSEDPRYAPAALRMLARFYRWLGDTGRLDAERAHLIAWRLDSCRVALAA